MAPKTSEVTTRAEVGGVGFVGNSVFSDKKLAKETKLKSGGTLSDAAILDAKRNLEKYYQGYGYPDATVSYRLQPTGQKGVSDLIFVIDEGVKNEIHTIRFEGNHVFSDVELRKNMKVKEKSLLSFLTKSGRFETGQLDEDLDSVLDYYRSHYHGHVYYHGHYYGHGNHNRSNHSPGYDNPGERQRKW